MPLKVPHMGWNTIYKYPKFGHCSKTSLKTAICTPYIVIMQGLTEQTIASSNYEHEFSAALQSNNFYRSAISS